MLPSCMIYQSPPTPQKNKTILHKQQNKSTPQKRKKEKKKRKKHSLDEGWHLSLVVAVKVKDGDVVTSVVLYVTVSRAPLPHKHSQAEVHGVN